MKKTSSKVISACHKVMLRSWYLMPLGIYIACKYIYLL